MGSPTGIAGLQWRASTEPSRDAPVTSVFINARIRVFLGLVTEHICGMAVPVTHYKSSPVFLQPGVFGVSSHFMSGKLLNLSLIK